MKKEHYDYISERFNLAQFSESNAPVEWTRTYEGDMHPSSVQVSRDKYDGDMWNIKAKKTKRLATEMWILFSNIPSEELAEEIAQHIRNTEVLFV